MQRRTLVLVLSWCSLVAAFVAFVMCAIGALTGSPSASNFVAFGVVAAGSVYLFLDNLRTIRTCKGRR